MEKRLDPEWKRELEAYESQINHESFGKTTEDFQDYIIKNVFHYIAYIPDMKTRAKMHKKFEDKLNVTVSDYGDGSTTGTNGIKYTKN